MAEVNNGEEGIGFSPETKPLGLFFEWLPSLALKALSRPALT